MELNLLKANNLNGVVRKVISLVILLLISLGTCYSQEKLLDILERLSSNCMTVDIAIKENISGYIECMKYNHNFYYQDREAIYFNSDENYSVYLVVDKSVFANIKPQIKPYVANDAPKLALLFDKKNQICYLVKYGFSMGNRIFTFNYLEKDRLSIEAYFHRGVSLIAKLNCNLEPNYVAKVYEWRDAIANKNAREIGVVRVLSRKKNTYRFKNIEVPNLNIIDFTNFDLETMFPTDTLSIKYLDIEEQEFDYRHFWEAGYSYY